MADFAGFDPSRADSNTLKYNAYNVLQGLDPNDPNSINIAYNQLNASNPGQYQLDSQGNLMLTGTADGYIGARPVGWGSGGAWYDPGQGQYDWQWLAYNDAHQGPSGEGAGSGHLSGDGTTMLNQWGAPVGSPDSYRPPSTTNAPISANTIGQNSMFGNSNWSTQQANDLYNLLYKKASATLDFNASDPIIKSQVDAYDAKQQQAQQRYLAALAEKKGVGANNDAELRSTSEADSQATGAFQAQLMGQELAARRQEIQQALDGARGLLTAEQALQLQEELAQIATAERAYEFDTQQQYLNSPLNGA